MLVNFVFTVAWYQPINVIQNGLSSLTCVLQLSCVDPAPCNTRWEVCRGREYFRYFLPRINAHTITAFVHTGLHSIVFMHTLEKISNYDVIIYKGEVRNYR